MEERPSLYVTREVEFSAAHRIFREQWSDAENGRVFGPCANPHGHGHNYVLEVTVKGSPDPETGMVVHFHTLKQVLQESVVAPLDHQHLNHVTFLAGILPTSENLVLELWKKLAPALRERRLTLHRLRLASTSRNWVEYFGPQP